ncbi:MAG: ribbon-helix-helix protein, CopG family [Dehalococcoidia bacterium]|nr:ribbon-helix-helix protein, CopG family [Dehalococcoidia bacterium]
MKKTMVYLDEEMHEGLRKLAFENNTSIAELVRQAVGLAYGEDIEDIKDMEAELARYKAQSGSAVEVGKYLRRRKAHVSA